MSFEIAKINNGWLLSFHSETGFHRFFFEDFEDAARIMKEVVNGMKPIQIQQGKVNHG